MKKGRDHTQAELEIFLTSLQQLLDRPHPTVNLRLSDEVMPQFLSLLTKRYSRIVALYEQRDQLAAPYQFIPLELTEQEQSGLVSTPSSAALHRFLLANDSAEGFFVLPIPTEQLRLPDNHEYQKLMTRLTIGERFAFPRLMTCGYTRHQRSLEPGSIRIRGEAIDVAHPVLPGSYTITLYGDVIESIVHHHGQRSTVVKRLALPPMKFPVTIAPISALLQSYLVIRPAHRRDENGQRTIIYDAVQPDLVFPVKPLPPREPELKPLTANQAARLIGQLTAGKPAVHTDHGIGIYEGPNQRTLDGQPHDYLVLRYAAGDTVSVPVEYAHKVTAYLGQAHPPLHRLGGVVWQKTRRHAQHDAAAFARELVTIARRRHGKTRPAYQVLSSLEDYLTRTATFTLTPDQETTWQAVMSDLQQPQPMDRLVVGDVGFGKTEVAQRAAAHAVENGRQVAVIAPTTLLVQQHYDTFRQRLPHLSDRIGLLSRFVSPHQQKQVRQGMAQGTIAIVIGTSALLSKSIAWKNLALVIIDEEQRFGVAQKEHLKKLSPHIDILSLSATPIPRTLSMALSGLKKLSVISTPPAGRRSVITRVGPDTDTILQQAISQELARGGQVYVVNPTIRGLSFLERRIHALLPGARCAIAHAQMDDRHLAHVMDLFDNGQLDVLISSTIVENGLDLPNVNTLIVHEATRLGLSDLYQLRGRVGRRSRQGYSYFLFNQRALTPLQRQRLAALTEAARLGSGWQLAQRDLEIRGAGNLLGAQQSGSINAVGLQFYLDLIEDAVSHSPSGMVDRREVEIELPVTALLPPTYVPAIEERTAWYQRLTRARSLAELAREQQLLAASYGPLPTETQTLLGLLELQHAAATATITKISHHLITPTDEKPYYRLTIEARNAKKALEKLIHFGEWAVQGDTLTHYLPELTAEVIRRLAEALKKDH